MFLTLGELGNCEKELSEAAGKYKKNPVFDFALGEFYFRTSRFNRAVDQFNQTLSTHVLTCSTQAWIWAAELLARRCAGDLLLLRWRLKAFLGANRTPQEKLIVLYNLTLPRPELSSAEMQTYLISWCDRAAAFYPEEPGFILHKGALLHARGDTTQALNCLHRCLLYSRTFGAASFYLAQIQRKRGRIDRARRYAQWAKKECDFRWMIERLTSEFPAEDKDRG